MFASRTACSKCASQVCSARARKLGGAALYSTLNEPRSSPPAQAGAHEARREGGHYRRQHAAGSSKRGFGRPQAYSGHRNHRGGHAKSPEESAIELFNDVVKPGSRRSPAEASDVSPLTEWQVAAKIKELQESSDPPSEKIERLDKLIRSNVTVSPQGVLPKTLYLPISKFIVQICDEMLQEGVFRGSLKVSQLLARIEKPSPGLRNQLVRNICDILTQGNLPGPEKDRALIELADLWKHTSQVQRGSQGSEPLAFVFPTISEVMSDATRTGGNSRSDMTQEMKCLTSIFLQHTPDQAAELIPGLLATIAVVSDTQIARPAAQMKLAPLLGIVSAVHERQPLSIEFVTGASDGRGHNTRNNFKHLKDYVLNQWPAAVSMLTNKDADWRRPPVVPKQHSKKSAVSALFQFHAKLKVAYRARNSAAIKAIWEDLKARLAREPELAEEMRKDPEFLDFWVFVWCAVKWPSMLQETMEMMKQIAVRPTIRSYTSMMHGWKINKDGNKINALWQRLVESGIPLDAFIWTARVSGLIEGHKPQAGVEALAEMQKLWEKAVETNTQHLAVKPNIEVVNAALKGLMNIDTRAAHQILQWAGKKGIEPNVRTYNILLRQSFRAGSQTKVSSLLKAMDDGGIEPDSATFTIILEEVIGGMGNSTAAEQIQAVKQVFADIEAAGLQPNLETYGKMLYAVASLANGTDEAVDAVQDHMRAKGFKITPQMVTILVERLIARQHSQAAEIDALLRENNITHVGQGDQTLWERVMTAYAVTQDLDRAMSIFNELAGAGRPATSLSCLTDLLRALLDTGRKDEASRVVAVVLEHKMDPQREPVEWRYWHHHFWHVAKWNGLLARDSIPPELQRALSE